MISADSLMAAGKASSQNLSNTAENIPPCRWFRPDSRLGERATLKEIFVYSEAQGKMKIIILIECIQHVARKSISKPKLCV